jgi:hypothetical protein
MWALPCSNRLAHRLGVREGRDPRLDRVDHGPEPALLHPLALGKALGQGDHADRDRQPGLDRQLPGANCRGLAVQPTAFRSTQDSSVEPPPTSTTRAPSASRSNRLMQPGDRQLGLFLGRDDLQPQAGLLGDAADELGTIGRPRQAWVATALTRTTLRRRIFSAQTFSAAIERSMASSDSWPVWDSPSPSRTIRE